MEGKNNCKSNPTGTYSGGRHGAIQPGVSKCHPKRESHHTPSDYSYPKGSPSRDDMPAVQMDRTDHHKTASHNGTKSSLSGKAYREVQKKIMKEGLLPIAMAMDIIDIKMKFGNKYDEAITQMILWSVCMGYL